MRSFYAGLFVVFSCSFALAQSPAEALERDAVEIPKRSEANDSLYSRIKDYRAIMIGEVHGTKEPTEFFIGIIKSLIKNGRKVIAGVELPSDGVQFSSELTLEKLKAAPAFTSGTRDGRQSVAWAEMLMELQKTGAEIVCFDLSTQHKGEMKSLRDSLMYATLNEAMKKDTTKVLVTLSGNVASRLVPFHKVNSMGCYLHADANSVLKGKKMLSLIHMYNDGTAYNWMNNGYMLRSVEGNAGFYGAAAAYENYLLIYPAMDGYNGLIFSMTLTASGPLVESKK